jgi:hypothetical protein
LVIGGSALTLAPLLVGTVAGLVLIPVPYVMVQTVRERTKAPLFGSGADSSSPKPELVSGE